MTLNTKDRRHLFGAVKNAKMELSELGRLAQTHWLAISEHYPNVTLDEYQFMPDHMHGILVIRYVGDAVAAQNFEPRQRQHRYQQTLPKSVGSIIRAFKSSVTQWSRERNLSQTVWQRNFYEHIIRSYREWEAIRAYIRQNPAQWERDHIKTARTASNDSKF